MSQIANLSDVYTNKLKDLWSANDQMLRVVKLGVEAAQGKSSAS